MQIKALTFDTGGTVLDWHTGLARALARAGEAHGVLLDWHGLANDWRRRAMKSIIGQVRPAFNMDDVHRRTLAETLVHHQFDGLNSAEIEHILSAWHSLDAWPDFPQVLAELRTLLPVASFTMLPTSLVVDVSRRNGLTWDAIVSCEMIGIYKPHLEAYAITARWLDLKPENILMVACHNFDLNAAKMAGYQTAFIRRPDEWGPSGPPDPNPNMEYDFVEDDFISLLGHIRRAI